MPSVFRDVWIHDCTNTQQWRDRRFRLAADAITLTALVLVIFYTLWLACRTCRRRQQDRRRARAARSMADPEAGGGRPLRSYQTANPPGLGGDNGVSAPTELMPIARRAGR